MKQNKFTLLAVTLLGGIIAFSPILSVRADDATSTTGTNASAARAAGRGDKWRELLQSLNLTPEQKNHVTDAMKNMREQMKALRDDTALDGEAKRAKMKTITEGMIAKVKPVLKPDQLTKFEAGLKQIRGESGAGANRLSNGATKPLPTTPTPDN